MGSPTTRCNWGPLRTAFRTEGLPVRLAASRQVEINQPSSGQLPLNASSGSRGSRMKSNGGGTHDIRFFPALSYALERRLAPLFRYLPVNFVAQ